MKRTLLISFFASLLFLFSCTDCSECEFYYVPSSSLDTVRGNDSFCGKIKTVKGFEENFEADAQNIAFLAGSTAHVNCTRVPKN